MYIHFGSAVFDRKRFTTVQNRKSRPKPLGGFWASPVTSKGSSWADFCRHEDYPCDLRKSFRFELPLTARVLHIDNMRTLRKLPKSAPDEYDIVYLDYERLAKEYDAVEFHVNKNEALRYALYGIEADSVLILNPDVMGRAAVYSEGRTGGLSLSNFC